MRIHRFFFCFFLFITQFAWSAPTTSSLAEWTKISHPFRGIAWIHIHTFKPRLIDLSLVKVDLADPGIRFTVTGPNGKAQRETTLETTRAFARRVKAQVAVNASFFTLSTPPYVDNIGLVVANGIKYSTFTQALPALAISRDNVARIVEQDPTDKTGYGTLPRMKPWNAVGGNEWILKRGANVAHDTNLHPRTAAGVSADGKKLILLIADGRNALHSKGITTLEAADFLKKFGAVDAINLDGGGSTTLVIADPIPKVVNIPVGIKNIPYTERPVGVNLGIYADK